MPGYSIDLRKRVIEKVNDGKMQLKDISKLFKIDVKTIYRWRKKLKDTGSLAAKTNFQKGHSHKITNLELFQKFVKENSDLTLKEMAKKWGDVSPQTIYRALKKINFTFKKNSFFIKNVTKKKEKIF